MQSFFAHTTRESFIFSTSLNSGLPLLFRGQPIMQIAQTVDLFDRLTHSMCFILFLWLLFSFVSFQC
jgi:hypothetical protein